MTRIAVFVVDDTSTKQVFQASSWLLGRAIEVHWSSTSLPRWTGVPNLFSNAPVSSTDSFKTMLPFPFHVQEPHLTFSDWNYC
jgi:hypothetical protein